MPNGYIRLPYTEANAVAMGIEQDSSGEETRLELAGVASWRLIWFCLYHYCLALLCTFEAMGNGRSTQTYRDRNRKMPMTRLHQKVPC